MKINERHLIILCTGTKNEKMKIMKFFTIFHSVYGSKYGANQTKNTFCADNHMWKSLWEYKVKNNFTAKFFWSDVVKEK